MRTDEVPKQLRGKWASIRETCEELAISRGTVHRLINAKQLDTRKYFGDRTFISRASIQAILDQYLDD